MQPRNAAFLFLRNEFGSEATLPGILGTSGVRGHHPAVLAPLNSSLRGLPARTTRRENIVSPFRPRSLTCYNSIKSCNQTSSTTRKLGGRSRVCTCYFGVLLRLQAAKRGSKALHQGCSTGADLCYTLSHPAIWDGRLAARGATGERRGPVENHNEALFGASAGVEDRLAELRLRLQNGP